jgi:hypothetical protein
LLGSGRGGGLVRSSIPVSLGWGNRGSIKIRTIISSVIEIKKFANASIRENMTSLYFVNSLTPSRTEYFSIIKALNGHPCKETIAPSDLALPIDLALQFIHNKHPPINPIIITDLGLMDMLCFFRIFKINPIVNPSEANKNIVENDSTACIASKSAFKELKNETANPITIPIIVRNAHLFTLFSPMVYRNIKFKTNTLFLRRLNL